MLAPLPCGLKWSRTLQRVRTPSASTKAWPGIRFRLRKSIDGTHWFPHRVRPGTPIDNRVRKAVRRAIQDLPRASARRPFRRDIAQAQGATQIETRIELWDRGVSPSGLDRFGRCLDRGLTPTADLLSPSGLVATPCWCRPRAGVGRGIIIGRPPSIGGCRRPFRSHPT